LRRGGGVGVVNIPVLFVQARSLAEAYEQALISLHRQGVRLATQYDRPGDPLSIDGTMNITVLEPWSDPMIHKAFPGGIEDLREYVLELTGAKDHWVKNMNDPEDTRWEYTYHGRLQAYGSWRERRGEASVPAGPFRVDQIEKVIAKLVEQPHTRQAQMITWMPNLDFECYDPPCLQSLWYRLAFDQQGTGWLNCNVRFRSNDAWGASFMNMFGFIQFNRAVIADEVARRSGRRIELGRLNWQADSYHIYGRSIEEAEARLFRRLGSSSFADRVFNFHDPEIRQIYEEAREKALQKIQAFDRDHPASTPPRPVR
jgi:thymidylate synthase